MAMRLIRRPWIWIARFRKRKGYGVHSPSAYSFIRGVVLETSPYYAYAALSRRHPWWVRWGRLYPLQCRRLLFRLANFAEPQTAWLLTEDAVAEEYVRAAVPGAAVRTGALDGMTGASAADRATAMAADFVLLGADHVELAPAVAAAMPRQGMLVCEGIHRNAPSLAAWRAVQQAEHTGVTFDLYTYGVAFFDPTRHKQHYKVSF